MSLHKRRVLLVLSTSKNPDNPEQSRSSWFWNILSLNLLCPFLAYVTWKSYMALYFSFWTPKISTTLIYLISLTVLLQILYHQLGSDTSLRWSNAKQWWCTSCNQLVRPEPHYRLKSWLEFYSVVWILILLLILQYLNFHKLWQHLNKITSIILRF